MAYLSYPIFKRWNIPESAAKDALRLWLPGTVYYHDGAHTGQTLEGVSNETYGFSTPEDIAVDWAKKLKNGRALEIIAKEGCHIKLSIKISQIYP